MYSISQFIRQENFTIISNVLAAHLQSNDAAAVFSVIADKQDYYFKAGKMTVIDGEPYFYFLQPQIAEKAHMSVKRLQGNMKKLVEEELIFVKRKGNPGKNYYRINNARLIELFDTEEADTEAADRNYLKVQMEQGRAREEVEKELEQVAQKRAEEAAKMAEIMARKQAAREAKAAAKREEAAAAVEESKAKLQEIGDMLPTGMNNLQQQPAAEPEPAPFVQVKEPARPAPKKKEAEEQAELIRSVWRESKFRLINDYLLDTRDWTELFVAEICSSLEMYIDPEIVSIVDIDAGILDYINAPTKVSRPSKYIGRCIARQTEERYIKMGIDIAGLDMRVKSARFIEQLRTIRPNDPAVLAYDREMEMEKAAILA